VGRQLYTESVGNSVHKFWSKRCKPVVSGLSGDCSAFRQAGEIDRGVVEKINETRGLPDLLGRSWRALQRSCAYPRKVWSNLWISLGAMLAGGVSQGLQSIARALIVYSVLAGRTACHSRPARLTRGSVSRPARMPSKAWSRVGTISASQCPASRATHSAA
jgi:hypothetical protein